MSTLPSGTSSWLGSGARADESAVHRIPILSPYLLEHAKVTTPLEDSGQPQNFKCWYVQTYMVKNKQTKTIKTLIKSSVSGLPGVGLRAWDLKYFLNQMEHLLNKTHG